MEIRLLFFVVAWKDKNQTHRDSYVRIVQMLLKRDNCGIALRNKNCKNALMHACNSAFPEIVELLLRHSECDPCQQDQRGDTALIICCYGHSSLSVRENRVRIVKKILKHKNCGIAICNDMNQNALMYACQNALPEIVELLLSHIKCDPCQQDLSGNTPIMYCCFAKNYQSNLERYVRIVQMLLKRDICGMAVCNKVDMNALMYACVYALPEIVELLLSHSECNPCQQDRNGYTALMLCCISAAKEISNHDKCKRIVQMLLKDDNSSIALCDKRGLNALMYACKKTLPEFVELLLNHKRCDICVQDINGLTCLHHLFQSLDIVSIEKIFNMITKCKQFFVCIRLLDKHDCSALDAFLKNTRTSRPEFKISQSASRVLNALLTYEKLMKSSKSQGNQIDINKFNTDLTRTNISDINHSCSNLSNSGIAVICTSAHNETISRVRIDKNILNDVSCHFQPSLVETISRGNFSAAENMLLSGTNDINKPDRFGNTPLIMCCIYTHENLSESEQCLNIMKLLLKQASCSVNIGNDYGQNALMLACLFALPKYVEILLNDSRCDPCWQDHDGHTALIICCYKENPSLSHRKDKIRIVKMLLKHENSGIAICNNKGQSALGYACIYALSEAVELLLSHTLCDPSHQDLDGATPLIACCYMAGQTQTHLDRYVRIVQMLLKQNSCGISICDKEDKNAIMYACIYALPEIVELLLSHSECNPCQQNLDGNTPLINCCLMAGQNHAKLNKYVLIIQMLLKQDNCGIAICNKKGLNALMYACEFALPDIVEMLLSHSMCDPNQQDLGGNTALIRSCLMTGQIQINIDKYVHIVQMLLKRDNCSVAISNKEGRNALMYACMLALPEIVKLLLSHSKCDPCQQDEHGQTALIICCYGNDLSLSYRKNNVRIVKMLLKHENCGIAICNDKGQSALMYACQNALPEIVELLLNHKVCDPCQQDLSGNTPIIFCCCKERQNQAHQDSYVRIVQMLLKRDNCGIALCNKNGENALMYACKLAFPEIVELLLSHSECDPCQQDQHGQTALIICCFGNDLSLSHRENNVRIVKMLLKHENCGIAI